MHFSKVTAPVFTVVSRVNDETRARMSEFAALSKQIFDLGQPVRAVVV